jgi:hypothetical protein
MKLEIGVSRPKAFLNRIKAAIDDGTVATWSYDADGDFTHTPKQWVNKAWLRPSVDETEGTITLVVVHNTDATVKGVYLGRFAEMLVSHFEGSVSYVLIQ